MQHENDVTSYLWARNFTAVDDERNVVQSSSDSA